MHRQTAERSPQIIELWTIVRVFQQGRYKSRATGTANNAIFLAALLTFLMESCMSQQRDEIIKIYYRNSESVASTLRALRPIYCRNNRPSRSTIERLVENLNPQAQYNMFPLYREYCCRWGFRWRKPKFVSHASFSSVGHRCDVVVANFAKCSWPTSLQNQIHARTEAAWPPEPSYIRQLDCATTWKWFDFI